MGEMAKGFYIERLPIVTWGMVGYATYFWDREPEIAAEI